MVFARPSRPLFSTGSEEHQFWSYAFTILRSYLLESSTLQVETKVGLLLFEPTMTSIPYSLRSTLPCATVWPPELMDALLVPAGR